MTQPDKFDWATELSDAQGHVTLSEQEAHEIGARLRRQHTENERLAALVEAQQPAPSAAAPCANCGEDKNRHNGLRCVNGAENAYFAPQADSQPAAVLDSLALMKVVMRADEALAGRCTRGTTNWAAAIGKAVQDAVLADRAPADSVTAPKQEPVAYAIFAENGNIRLWATEPQHVKRIAAEQGLSLVKLYTAPQPAPAPLSEREMFEETWEKAHGKKPVLWETMFAQQKQETPAHCVGRYYYREEQSAWGAWQARAALAAQGGK